MSDFKEKGWGKNAGGAPPKSLSEEVADWERTLWERPPPGNGLAKEVAEWEHTLIENGRGGEE